MRFKKGEVDFLGVGRRVEVFTNQLLVTPC